MPFRLQVFLMAIGVDLKDAEAFIQDKMAEEGIDEAAAVSAFFATLSAKLGPALAYMEAEALDLLAGRPTGYNPDHGGSA